MKPYPVTSRSAQNLRKSSLTLLALFAAGSTSALTLTWDTTSGDGATITPADGTWDLTGSNLVWNNAGANPNLAWAQTNTTTPLHAAIFAGADAGTKSIVVGTDIAANSLTFNNSGYTLSAATAQTVRLNGDLNVASGKSATIGANTTVTRTTTAALNILGGGTLTIQGTGARVIGNSNNVAIGGGTTVDAQTGGTFSGPSQMVVGSNGAGGNLLVNGGSVSAGSTGTTSSGAQNIVLHNLTTAGSSDLTINSGSVINLGTGRASSGESGLRLGATASTTAAVSVSVNLNGGTLTVARVYEGNSGSGLDSTFNFNGGTLKVTSGAGNAANYLGGLNNAFVKEGGAIFDTNGVATTVAQVLQHGGAAPTDGGLTKRGTGTLTLTGNNTFTGTTTVDAGTLSLGRSGGTLLDTAAVNVNGGTLDVAQADTVGAVTLTSGTISGAAALTGTSYTLKSGTVSSELAGSGVALTKDTSGTVVLGGTQSYTGSTNVTAGTLQVTGSLAGAVNVNAGGTLAGEGSTGSSLNFAAGSTTFNYDVTTGTAFTAASVAVDGSAFVLLNPIGSVTNGTPYLVLTNNAGFGGGIIPAGFAPAARGSLSLANSNTSLNFTPTAAASLKWTGANGSNPTFWDPVNTVNWDNGGSGDRFYANDAVTLDDTASSFTVAVQGASVSPGALVVNNSTNSYTLSGGAISGTTLTKSGTNTLIVSNANTLSGGTTISGGTIQLGDGSAATGSLSGPIVNNAALVTNYGSNNATVGNNISGSGSLTQSGSGTVSLTGTNSYGATTINSGILQIGSGGAGGTLGSGAVTNNATLAFNLTGPTTVANAIGGTGAVTKLGTGSVTLSSANTYTGLTTVSIGGLIASANDALGTTATGTTVTPGTSLGFSGGITYSTSEKITGSGVGTTVASTGAFTAVQRGFVQSVSGNNTFAGNIEINATGLSRIGTQDGAQLTLTGTITPSSGVTGVSLLFRAGATNGDFVTLSNSGNNWDNGAQIFTGASSGSAGVRLGANDALPVTQNITGASSTSAFTTLDLNGYNQTLNGLINSPAGNASTLTISNSNSGQVSTLTLATLSDKTAGAGVNATTIADGAGQVAVVKSGSFNQTFNNPQTFTGGTTIEAGTLTLGHATDTLANSGAINVSGGTLAIGANSDTVGAVTLTSGSITGSTGVLTGSAYDVQSGTVSAKLGGSASLTKSTAGTVTLSGANTFTGTISVSGGTLVIDGSIASTAALSVDASATLRGTGSIASASTITGTLATGDTNTLGDLTFTSTLSVPGTLSLKFDSSTGTFDKVFANGFTTTLGTLSLTDIAGVPAVLAPNSTFTLLDNTSLASIGGSFAGLNEGASISVGGNTFSLSYVGGTGNDLVLTAIPEPSAFAALAGLAGLLATGLRRRRGDSRP